MARLRALCLHGTELARASVGTIRLRLLKIAGQVSVKRAPGACAHGQQLARLSLLGKKIGYFRGLAVREG